MKKNGHGKKLLALACLMGLMLALSGCYIAPDDINDRIGTSLSSEEYDSIGGYVIERLDHLPVAHEKVQTEDGLVLSVESMNRKRIGRVRLTLPEKTAEEE